MYVVWLKEYRFMRHETSIEWFLAKDKVTAHIPWWTAFYGRQLLDEGKEERPLLHLVVAIENAAFWSPLTTTTIYIYIYIYILKSLPIGRSSQQNVERNHLFLQKICSMRKTKDLACTYMENRTCMYMEQRVMAQYLSLGTKKIFNSYNGSA